MAGSTKDSAASKQTNNEPTLPQEILDKIIDEYLDDAVDYLTDTDESDAYQDYKRAIYSIANANITILQHVRGELIRQSRVLATKSKKAASTLPDGGVTIPPMMEQRQICQLLAQETEPLELMHIAWIIRYVVQRLDKVMLRNEIRMLKAEMGKLRNDVRR